MRLDLLPDLKRLRIPSFTIHGSRDLLVPWRRARWTADALGGVFSRLRGAGHLPYVTHAGEFNARLSRFLETFHLYCS
jgi:pimeloyl-ACP methyl ester carboxylesterase